MDGPTLVGEALDAGVELVSVYVEPAALTSPLLERVGDVGVGVRIVAEGALAKALDLRSPQAMVAVAATPTTEPADVVAPAAAGGGPLLVAVEVADPGNLGTLLRVAEASGCSGVITTEGSVDLHAPKVVRASAGSIFRVPCCGGVELAALLDSLADAGVELAATVPRRGHAPEDVDLRGPLALLVGSEAHGLPSEVCQISRHRIEVPMAGRVESLNAAVAAAVVLFDAARQRRAERSGSEPAPVGHNVGPPRRGDDDHRPEADR